MPDTDATSVAIQQATEQREPDGSVVTEEEAWAQRAVSSGDGKAEGWRTWLFACKQVLPVYIAVHIAAFITACLSVLFTHRDFMWGSVPLSTLWQTWRHEDTGYYINIALNGYTEAWRTAFFPFYAILERGLTYIVPNPLLAGLIISNIAGLGVFVVLYRLVWKDFDREVAGRTVLYLALFPTAFFLMAAYNESLFICLSLLSFYQMRHGRWWLAGLIGFFASLTRSAGLFLLVPFCYEYLRQHEFRLRALGFDVVWAVLIPAGIGAFGLYCSVRFGDVLAFSHAQAHWDHQFRLPWYAIKTALSSIRRSSGLLGFQALRNLTDLVPDLLVMVLLVLSLVGPWRWPRSHRSYCLYGCALFVFLQCFPINWDALPLQSMGRYMLEIFPAFIMLAMLGKFRMVHLNYLTVAGAVFFFLMTQFLIGHWVV